MGIYFNRFVDDFDAVFASSLVCYPANTVSGILSQSCLAYFYMYSLPFLFEVHDTSGIYAHMGSYGRISAPVCPTGDWVPAKKVY